MAGVACASPIAPHGNGVPVLGRTAAQAAAAHEELSEFVSWVGRGRLSVRSIEFRRLDPPFAGRFLPSRGVYLDEDLPVQAVRAVVRHELCHALDASESLSSERLPEIEMLAELLSEAEGAVFDVPLNEMMWRQEAFAEICESLPPLAAQLAGTTCGENNTGEFEDIADWIRSRVWTEGGCGHEKCRWPTHQLSASESWALAGRGFCVRQRRHPGSFLDQWN